MENKYNRGKIYKIVCDDGYYYYGSTCNELKHRFNNHKHCRFTRLRRHIEDRLDGDWSRAKIELVKDYPCENREELLREEDEHVKNAHRDIFCLNHNRVVSSQEEYRATHKEQIKEKKKECYENNKDLYLETNKRWRDENKERKKEMDKEYREKNKEKILEQSKKYTEDNKERINGRRRERIICECGEEISKGYEARHRRTKAHINKVIVS